MASKTGNMLSENMTDNIKIPTAVFDHGELEEAV